MANPSHTPPPRAGAARPDPGNPGRRSGASPAGDDPAAASGGAGRGDAALEDLHWRLDDHQRRVDGIERAISPDVIAAVVHGAVAALHATMQAETDRLLKSIKEDVDTDKLVVAAIGELVAELKQHRLATAGV